MLLLNKRSAPSWSSLTPSVGVPLARPVRQLLELSLIAFVRKFWLRSLPDRIEKPRIEREVTSTAMNHLPLKLLCYATIRWHSCWRGATSKVAILLRSQRISPGPLIGSAPLPLSEPASSLMSPADRTFLRHFRRGTGGPGWFT